MAIMLAISGLKFINTAFALSLAMQSAAVADDMIRFERRDLDDDERGSIGRLVEFDLKTEIAYQAKRQGISLQQARRLFGTDRMYIAHLDLDTDARDDILVYLLSSTECGQAGCPVYVFRETGGQWREFVMATVGSEMDGSPVVYVSDPGQDGHRDIYSFEEAACSVESIMNRPAQGPAPMSVTVPHCTGHPGCR